MHFRTRPDFELVPRCPSFAWRTVGILFLALFSSGFGRAQEALPPPPSNEFVFNFRHAPWEDVLARFAKEAGYSLQMNAIPPGNFDFLDSKAYTAVEALDVINGNLIQSGYILLRRDRFLVVHSLEEQISPHLLPQVQTWDLGDLGKNELVRITLHLDNVKVTSAAKEVESMLSPLGSVNVLTESNHLVITDLVANLRQVYRLLMMGEAESHSDPSIVIRLNNTPAEDVGRTINDFFTGRSSSTGGNAAQGGGGQQRRGVPDVIVVPETNTNSLVISAPVQYLAVVERLVHQLDAPPAQVVIQALLVEVDLNQTNELGVELGIQDSVLFDRSVVSNLVTVSETVTNGLVQTTNDRILSQESNPGFNFNNQALGNNTAVRPGQFGGQGLSNFAVGRINGDLGQAGLVLSGGSESVNVLLRALAAQRKVNILSRPQIRTVHNRPAHIQIGQQVPVVDGVSVTAVGSANPVIRQDRAGIILEVTPRINPNGTVVMDVTAEKSAFQLGAGAGVPIFTDATNGNVIEAPVKDITSAQATVSVQNGQVIVLGGMIGRNNATIESKVPFLGDVPLLGRLFRYDSTKSRRSELLIFLTPYVIRTSEDSDVHTQIESDLICLPEENFLHVHGRPGNPVDVQSTFDFETFPAPEIQSPEKMQSPERNDASVLDNDGERDGHAPHPLPSKSRISRLPRPENDSTVKSSSRVN